MKTLLFVISGLLSIVSIQAFSGDGTDIALSIRVNDQADELVVRPNEEVRVNFLATNNGPNDLNSFAGGFTGLIENFSFPFDIDCQNLGIGQARGFDPTDYVIVWPISPLAADQTRECQFSLRALSSTSANELIQIQYGPYSLNDPDPSNDVASFLITFVQVPSAPTAVPVLSAKTLVTLIFIILVLGAATLRSRARS